MVSSCRAVLLNLAPDFITNGCERPCDCCELNSESLEEQAVFITAESPLLPIKKADLPLTILDSLANNSLYFKNSKLNPSNETTNHGT